MLLAQFRVLPPKISSLASAIAVGGWLGGYLTPIFAGSGLYMTWLPLLIAGISYLADSGVRAFHERTGYRWFVPYGALNWVGFEMIRSFIPIMGTWGFVANTLYGQPWLIQPVSVFSIFGLGLLIMSINFGLALGVLFLFDRRWRLDPGIPPLAGRSVRRWILGVLAALVAWTGLSLALFRTPTTPTVRAAALHYDAGVPPWSAVDRFSELTRRAAQDGARIVVWPEIAIQGDPQVTNTDHFRQLAAETDAHLVLGYVVQVTERAWRNEATVLTPDGRFLGVYGKDHPVTFAGETSLTRGTYPVYDTPLGRLGTIICYDLDFTDTARITRNGAQLILVPSHDWPAIGAKHYTHLVFRAVENRVSMVKADNSGNDSVIVDPYGRIIVAALTLGGDRTGQALVADVPLGTGDSLAVRLGDWTGWIALAGMAFFIVYDPVTKARAKRRDERR